MHIQPLLTPGLTLGRDEYANLDIVMGADYALAR